MFSADRGCNNVSINQVCALQCKSGAQSGQRFDDFAFLIELFGNIGKVVLKPVVYSTADNIRHRMLDTCGKRNVSANAQRQMKDTSKSKLELICQALWCKEQDKPA